MSIQMAAKIADLLGAQLSVSLEAPDTIREVIRCLRCRVPRFVDDPCNYCPEDPQ